MRKRNVVRMNAPASLNKEKKFIKIRSIEYAGKQDVYNMEVRRHHNFSINGGIIVHNCQDASRYLVMGMWHIISLFLPYTERE